MVRLSLGILCAGLLACTAFSLARACGTAHRRGQEVQVARESAIIIWNPGSKVEQFIRRATFTTDAPDFGFLVPTPTAPDLAESKDTVFSFLEQVTAPEVVNDYEYQIVPQLGCGSKSAKSAAGVRVLNEQRIAGYKASVLEADSADALNDWLTKHNYTTRPDLTAWLAPYVKARWKITAFQIAKDATRQEIATSAVRMAFTTEKPFFPYSEPAEQREPKKEWIGSRLLRVFFVADRRYAGHLKGEKSWAGQTVWAGVLKDKQGQELINKLSLDAGIKPLWLTVFEDASSPRPGTADLYFAADPDQTEVRRPPIHERHSVFIGGWLCLGVLVLLVVAILFPILRSRRASA
jgi:hypothetical protein